MGVEGGTEAGKGQNTEQTGDKGKGGDEQGKGDKAQNQQEHLIPKSRFDEVNGKYLETKAQYDALRRQTENAVDPKKFQEIEGSLEETKAESKAKIALSRAGVTDDDALDFLWGRYKALAKSNRPPIEDWAKEVKAKQPAFFGGAASSGTDSSAGGDGKGSNTKTQQKGGPPNTDEGKDESSGTMSDPPITEELIAKMDVATYKRRLAEINTFLRTRGKR